MKKNKLIRITTIPLSLEKLIGGQMKFMKKSFEVIGVSSDFEALKIVGEKEKVRVKEIHMTRRITPIDDIKALWKMYWFLKKENPSIVHTHTPKAGIIGMLAAKFAGVPIRLHTVAGLPLLEVSGVKRKVLNFVERQTYKTATNVYPNSFGLKKIIEENNFCDSRKIKVIANGSSNGIDTEYFNPSIFSEEEKQEKRNQLGILKNDFVFVFVGRLVRDKGINELIQAYIELEKEQKNCKLLLVGPFESDLDPLLPETINEIRNNGKIISVGYQKDVRLFFALSNVLVFPSYREGFPNVVMQAGAMGLPAIVSDINGCNEIIKNNENGIIIPVKDTTAIFDAMQKIISDKELRTKLEGNSRKNISTLYEQKQMWEALLKEYNNLNKNVS